jgi:hypothetical protein
VTLAENRGQRTDESMTLRSRRPHRQQRRARVGEELTEWLEWSRTTVPARMSEHWAVQPRNSAAKSLIDNRLTFVSPWPV